MKTSLRIVTAAIVLAILAACGAKGPLFMPTKEAPAEEATPAEQPAADPTPPAEPAVTPATTPATTPDGQR